MASEQEARAQAEAANRAKDRFLAMLSHELRTPLTPVLLTVSAMLDDPRTPADFRPSLEMFRQNIGLEARLIDDLLDVMRTIRGKMSFHWDVVDAHALIGKALDICRSDIQDKRIRLTLDLAASEHHVRADAGRLQQVWWNLVKNAVKFTPEGGTIALRTRDEDGRLVVEVTDTGIGIEPAALSKIFVAFEQVENTITRRYGGLGLGLAISKAIVEAHGGALTAASAGEGRGATFTVVLATVPAAEAGTATGRDRTRRASGLEHPPGGRRRGDVPDHGETPAERRACRDDGEQLRHGPGGRHPGVRPGRLRHRAAGSQRPGPDAGIEGSARPRGRRRERLRDGRRHRAKPRGRFRGAPDQAGRFRHAGRDDPGGDLGRSG